MNDLRMFTYDSDIYGTDCERVQGSAVGGASVASAVQEARSRPERQGCGGYHDLELGDRKTRGTSDGNCLAGFRAAHAARRVVAAIGYGAVAAVVGTVLSPDFALAANIQTLETAGTAGISVMKYLGYTGAVLGAGAAGMAYAAGMGRGIVAAGGGVGAGGAVAVGADYAGTRFFGGAPAADPSVLISPDILSAVHSLLLSIG